MAAETRNLYLTDDLLTLQQVAAMLQCSVKTIYRTPFLRARVEYVGARLPRLRRSVVSLWLAERPKGVRSRQKKSA